MGIKLEAARGDFTSLGGLTIFGELFDRLDLKSKLYPYFPGAKKAALNVVSNGLKFSSIAQKIDAGIAEIKKIALVERFKGGFQRLKKAVTDIKLDNVKCVHPNPNVSNNKQEELSRLLNLYKDKYQPMSS